MTIEKKRAFVINCLFFACLLAILYICFKYLLAWLLPFVIGLITAACLQPIIRWIMKKTKFKRRFVAPLMAAVLVALVAIITIWIAYMIGNQLWGFGARLPGWFASTSPAVIAAINDQFDSFMINLSPELQRQILLLLSDISATIQSRLVSFSSNILGTVGNLASLLPSVLISIIISIVATFFITVEFENIKQFLKLQIPPKYRKHLISSWQTFSTTIRKMLTSYLFIMFITFVELAIGLSIMRVDYAVLLAAIISLVDILPVLGTGTVLIPWAVTALILKNFKLGIGLLILYLVITILRNILEPRIIGKQIGMHPLVTLMAMYLGLHVLGMPGMFLFPIALIMLKHLQDLGAIRVWHTKDRKE